MSIATQIQALQDDKTNIRNAILAKGGTSGEAHGFDDFATDIASIPSGITPSGSLSISANGTYDVTNYASANVNVPQYRKHWTITIPSQQTSVFTAVRGDSDVASNYNSDTAVAIYHHTAPTKDGRYMGMAYNIANPNNQYGFYRSTGSSENCRSPLGDPSTSYKSIIATANGDLQIGATSTNSIQSGTIELYFMW